MTTGEPSRRRYALRELSAPASPTVPPPPGATSRGSTASPTGAPARRSCPVAARQPGSDPCVVVPHVTRNAPPLDQ